MKHIDIEVHDLHVDIVVNGKIVAHSEDYASVSNARRAARDLIHAINHRPMRLVWWSGRMGSRKRNVVLVRELWQHWLGGKSNLVAMPVRNAETLPL